MEITEKKNLFHKMTVFSLITEIESSHKVLWRILFLYFLCINS